MQVEKMFHDCKDEHRLHGEWFQIEPRMAIDLVVIAVAVCVEISSSASRQDALLFANDHVWRIDNQQGPLLA